MFYHPKKQLLLLISIWLLAQLTCFFLWGTQTELESLKYIHAADYLLQHGNFPEKRYWFYSITVFIIALSKWMNTGHGFVFFIQLSISLFAHLSFYKSLRSQCRENHPAPFITVAILCLILPYQRWNFTLYTESVFYSLVLIFFSFCIIRRDLKIKTILIQAFLLFIVILSRPLGVLILIPWFLFLFFQAPRKIKFVLAASGLVGMLLFGFIVNTILSSISDWNVLRPFAEGSVICAMPLHSSGLSLKTEYNTPLLQLFHLIKTYPNEFLLLSLKKTRAFFLMTRYYYSTGHNFTLIILSALLYFPVMFTVFRKKTGSAYLLGLFIILFFYLAVLLQCDDYHNRFVLTLVPLFLYVGLFQLIQRFIRS